MPRIRTIKPEFPQSETMGRLCREARFLFIQLWTLVDDEGRARASSRMLASLLYPYDDDARDLMDGWLSELEAEGCVRRYAVDGSQYLDIPNWLKHQKIDKPSKSRLPAFDEHSREVAKPREEATTDLGPRTMDQDLGPSLSVAVATAIAPVVFEKFWEVYPHREGRNPKEPSRKKFLAIVRAGADPDELIRAAKRYADDMRRQGKLETQFVAQAITWLSQKGWEDYRPPPDDDARDQAVSDDMRARGFEWVGERWTKIEPQQQAAE